MTSDAIRDVHHEREMAAAARRSLSVAMRLAELRETAEAERTQRDLKQAFLERDARRREATR